MADNSNTWKDIYTTQTWRPAANLPPTQTIRYKITATTLGGNWTITEDPLVVTPMPNVPQKRRRRGDSQISVVRTIHEGRVLIRGNYYHLITLPDEPEYHGELEGKRALFYHYGAKESVQRTTMFDTIDIPLTIKQATVTMQGQYQPPQWIWKHWVRLDLFEG